MTTEAETNSEEAISSFRINKEELGMKIKIKLEEKEKNIKELSNEEALDIQIKYLQSSTKNLLYTIIQEESDNLSKSMQIISINNSINTNNNNDNKIIDEGNYLYLQNIYNKNYIAEIESMKQSINNKLFYISDKNKEYLQNKKFIERETNTVTQEKIEYFNEKENLEKELEILTINNQQNCKNNIDNNDKLMEELEIRRKKLDNLKNKYNKIFDDISSNKKEFPIIKNKNSMIQGENMVLNEKLKQKQIIWDQLRKDNEKIKRVVIKRQYTNNEPENKNKEKNNIINDGKEYICKIFIPYTTNNYSLRLLNSQDASMIEFDLETHITDITSIKTDTEQDIVVGNTNVTVSSCFVSDIMLHNGEEIIGSALTYYTFRINVSKVEGNVMITDARFVRNSSGDEPELCDSGYKAINIENCLGKRLVEGDNGALFFYTSSKEENPDLSGYLLLMFSNSQDWVKIPTVLE